MSSAEQSGCVPSSDAMFETLTGHSASDIACLPGKRLISLTQHEDCGDESSTVSDTEIADLRQQVDRLKDTRDRVLKKMDEIGEAYRSMFPDISRRITVLNMDMVELRAEIRDLNHTLHAQRDEEGAEESDGSVADESGKEDEPVTDGPEKDGQTLAEKIHAKRKEKRRKRSLKEMYRRICRLCHPDRTSHLSSEAISRLKNIYIEAQKVRAKDNLTAMVDLYVTASLLHQGMEDDEEILALKEEILLDLQMSRDKLIAEMQDIQQRLLFHVYMHEQRGAHVSAQTVFRNDMMDHIRGLEESRSRLIRERDELLKRTGEENEQAET